MANEVVATILFELLGILSFFVNIYLECVSRHPIQKNLMSWRFFYVHCSTNRTCSLWCCYVFVIKTKVSQWEGQFNLKRCYIWKLYLKAFENMFNCNLTKMNSEHTVLIYKETFIQMQSHRNGKYHTKDGTSLKN